MLNYNIPYGIFVQDCIAYVHTIYEEKPDNVDLDNTAWIEINEDAFKRYSTRTATVEYVMGDKQATIILTKGKQIGDSLFLKQYNIIYNMRVRLPLKMDSWFWFNFIARNRCQTSLGGALNPTKYTWWYYGGSVTYSAQVHYPVYKVITWSNFNYYYY